MKTSILVLTAFLLLLATSGIWAQEPVVRNRNGIRLVGDVGPRGRLEVSTRDPRFPGLRNGSVAWLPVCDSGCTDKLAETMCKLLGYSYGRKYYSPRVNYRPATSGNTAGYFSCNKRDTPGIRRQLSGLGSRADVTAAAAPGSEGPHGSGAGHLTGFGGGGDRDGSGDGGGGGGQHVRARAALGISRYNISMPPNATYSCAFYFGNCESRGPLAAVECSHTTIPPSLPPPPVPPSPPSAPTPYTDSIRLVGGAPNRGFLEPNLCPSSAPPGYCSTYGRVELLVPSPVSGGVRLWAPLCAPDNNLLRVEVGRIACQQEYDWPSLRSSSAFAIAFAVPGDPPYALSIPTGPTTARGEFNPAGVWVWANIDPLMATSSSPRTLQEFGITVSTQPCIKGGLFALSCNITSSK